MADDFPRDRPHIFLGGNGETEPYRRPTQAIGGSVPPQRDRLAHALALENSIGRALAAARAQLADRDAAITGGVPGFYLEVEIPATERIAIDQLANRRQKIEVVAVREPAVAGGPLVASVFVPERAGNYYLRACPATT